MLGVALALTLAASQPPAIPPYSTITVFGAGNWSCARWLSDESEGTTWVLGMWSGLNYAYGAEVGRTTDDYGIIGAVELECRADPSTPLVNAVQKAYRKLRAKGV